MNTKPSIRQNVWGNWYGYIGRKRVEMFFNDAEKSQEENAKEWLKRQLNNEPEPAQDYKCKWKFRKT